MKRREEPVFMMAALCLFFPVGLFLLMRSERPRKTKWIMSACGFMVFAGLLSVAFTGLQKRPANTDFQLIVTRPVLSIGQSGGLAVTTGDFYYTDFSVTAENDILSVHHNVYTAQQTGYCILRVVFADECRTIGILVDDGPATDQRVFASPSGQRYHKSASHAGKNAVEITEEEALQSGKTPCKICYKSTG